MGLIFEKVVSRQQKVLQSCRELVGQSRHKFLDAQKNQLFEMVII